MHPREHVICNVLARNTILEMARSSLGERLVEIDLVMGKVCGLHGVT
jgi:hypothetical protein